MLETGVNILNLPLFSNFVNYAIGMLFYFFMSGNPLLKGVF